MFLFFRFPDNIVDEDTVATKLKNVRDKLRKVQQELQGTTGDAAEALRLSVSWYEDAHFLLPHVQVRKVRENVSLIHFTVV